MPEVNLSTMSAPELRRLLDSTRARGEAALSYQILQEMAARREGRGRRGLFLMRRPAKPRVIAVDLGDPMEPEEDDLPPLSGIWRGLPPLERGPEPGASAPQPPEPEPAPSPAPRLSRRRKAQAAPVGPPAQAAPVAAVDVEPALTLEPMRPHRVRDADPEPFEDEAANSWDAGLELQTPEPEGLRPPRRLSRGPAVAFAAAAVAAFAVGAAAGVSLGWWAGGSTRQAQSPPAAPAAAPIRTAALARRPAPARAPVAPEPVVPTAAEPEPAPETPADPAVGAPPPDIHESSQAATDAAEVAPGTGEAMELPAPPPARRKAEAAETPRTAAAGAAPAGSKACAAQPTPADREICADPELRRLQRELRQAYAKALDAHQDRALLRQRQLAWRSDRDTVSDPLRLARLYEQRIRKLNAATAEARQQR
jgi:uncharacterized protein YecT (DUF1311 family)